MIANHPIIFFCKMLSGLGGVMLTRKCGQMGGQTDRQTNRVIPIYPQKLCLRGYITSIQKLKQKDTLHENFALFLTY
jgi:hypothetical protein